MILMLSAGAMLLGFALELLVGWPNRVKHPIVLIGALVSKTEKLLRRVFPKTHRGERAAGIVMAAAVPLICLALSGAVTGLLYWLHPAAGAVAETLMFWSIFAAGSLEQAAMDVYHGLEQGIEQGRYAVSMIVGRDTDALTETGVIKAAVETVAENTADGIVSPGFFAMLGGAPLAYFYKAVNTMDSMCGYKNDKYLYYGTGAARLDDVCNYIPARMSGLVMTAMAGVCGLNGKNAWRIFRRDRYNHASPNSAQTESVMAGALEVQLAGDAVYFGKVYKKKTIGDPIRPIERGDIPRACGLMKGTCWAAVLILAIVRFAAGLLLAL